MSSAASAAGGGRADTGFPRSGGAGANLSCALIRLIVGLLSIAGIPIETVFLQLPCLGHLRLIRLWVPPVSAWSMFDLRGILDTFGNEARIDLD